MSNIQKIEEFKLLLRDLAREIEFDKRLINMQDHTIRKLTRENADLKKKLAEAWSLV